MRPMNVLPTAILRSPAHRLMSRSTLLLTFTGRNSGRVYTVPVVYFEQGGTLMMTTDSRWWKNLVGGGAVMLLLRGRQVPASAVADPDPQHVQGVLQEMVRRYPRRYARLAQQHAAPGASQRVVVEISVADGART
jgi:hypothetical protein